MTETFTEDLIQLINYRAKDAMGSLQCIIGLLQSRSISADFFRGMINRIESERKRVCRQIARERADGKE